MFDKSKTKLLVLEYTIILYFILYFFNFIYMNIMITRPDDIYLSDVLLWIHIIYMIGGYIYLKSYQKKKHVQIVIPIYKQFLLALLLLHVVYFMSVYLQSYILIDDTLIIIRDKILRGNPALILNFSNLNYETLSYVVSLLQSVNSPLIILFMSLWTMRFYYHANAIDNLKEPLKRYDDFLYKMMIPFLWFLLMIASFLSINLLAITYTFIQSLEMLFSILLFLLSSVAFSTSFTWFKYKNKPSKPSLMTKLHHFLYHLLKPIFVLTFGLLLYHIFTGYLSYRIYTVLIALAIQLILWLYHLRLKRLD
jgi:hypothetical protein